MVSFIRSSSVDPERSDYKVEVDRWKWSVVVSRLVTSKPRSSEVSALGMLVGRIEIVWNEALRYE